MKEYKRFTERLPNGVCRVKCNEHCENFKDSQERMCDSYQECDIAAVGYLAELEDKIENGTLIELPCKVGDKIYHLSSKTICEEVVKQIKYVIYNGEIDLLNSHIMTDDIYSKDYNFYRLSKLGKSVFLTKAEAEAKLKELKGEV